MKDLTIGNESCVIFRFTLPILCGNLLQQLYATIDSIIVGNCLGKNALAVVSACFNIIFILLLIEIGLTLGTNILIARYYGAKNMLKVKQAVDTAYIFLFATALVITILGILFSKYILIFFKVPFAILPEADIFFKIMLSGTISSFGYNTVSSIFRGIGDSKTPLFFLMLSTILNIILDFIFIIWFKIGINGAALATVISQTFSFAASFIYLNKHCPELKFRIKNICFNKEIFKLSFQIGFPAALQKIFLSGGFAVTQILINGFGSTAMAAFAAASRLDAFAQMPAANLGDALSVFTAQNLGAKKSQRVRKGYISTFAIGAIICAVISTIVITYAKPLMQLFVQDVSVVKIGVSYLTIVGLFYIAYCAMNVTNGVLLGMGNSFIPMLSTIVSLWCIQIPIAVFLTYKIGISGIWLGIPAGWISGFCIRFFFYMRVTFTRSYSPVKRSRTTKN